MKLVVLHVVKTAQNLNGLRHGNYLRYRYVFGPRCERVSIDRFSASVLMARDTSRSILQCSKYCSRKIHRIRVTLGITQVTTKRKQKREKEKEPKVCANAAERTLMLPLFLAERAWSYAMQLKEVLCCLKKPPHRSESFRADSAPCSNTCPCVSVCATRVQEASDDNSRVKFHLLRRLTKATKWSSKLQELCASSGTDDRTLLEAEVLQRTPLWIWIWIGLDDHHHSFSSLDGMMAGAHDGRRRRTRRG